MKISEGIKNGRADITQTAIGPAPTLELLDSYGEVICYGSLPTTWLTKAEGGTVTKSGVWEMEAQREAKPSSYRIFGGGEEISGPMSQMAVKSPIKQGQTVVIEHFTLSEP